MEAKPRQCDDAALRILCYGQTHNGGSISFPKDHQQYQIPYRCSPYSRSE